MDRPNSAIYNISIEANETLNSLHLEETLNSNKKKSYLYDTHLLNPLKNIIKKNTNGAIILHTRGSHKDYSHRVPEGFSKYTPTCEKECFNNITSLNNTYDNTIVYTDFFLNEVINELKDKDAILLYLSDHGESLGKNGVLGHSAPFETAPEEQTHIPMIWWASDKFLSNQENFKKFERIKSNFDKRLDQSYIFHSVLDCMGVDSPAINKNKSVCRPISK